MVWFMNISLAVVGALGGGCSRQAVSAWGDPLGWLKSRVRRAVAPGPGRSLVWGQRSQRSQLSRERVSTRVLVFLSSVQEALGALPESRTGGRPVKRNPDALAQWLGVSYQSGDTLFVVFNRWLETCLKGLNEALRGQRNERWDTTSRKLDKLWFARRTPKVATPSKPPPKPAADIYGSTKYALWASLLKK